MSSAPTGAVPGPRRGIAAQALTTAAVLVVAALLGVAIGGVLLAALGLTLCLVLAVIGLTLWRRRRRGAASVAWAGAVVAGALAIVGFVDAVS